MNRQNPGIELLLACVVENRSALLSLVEICPPLSHVVLVIESYRYPRVVPSIWCFHASYSHQRKRYAFLQVVWNTRLHLRLISGCAVMGRNQVVTVSRDHGNHG